MRYMTAVAIATLALAAASVAAEEPVLQLELIGVYKIWDAAPHSAFTDLVFWKGAFRCAFREGRGHVSSDGRIRVIHSQDAHTWNPTEPVSLDGYDLRDPKLSVAPEDRLMLLGGAAPREEDGQRAPTGTFVSFSENGIDWSKPRIVAAPGRWLWRVTWYNGKAYGIAYAAPDRPHELDLLVSTDGIAFSPHVRKLYAIGRPCEATLRFDRWGACWALVRRERVEGGSATAILGISRGDLTKWQWHDLGPEFNSFGGPNLIQLPTGYWITAGRMHAGGAHTALCVLDPLDHTMTKLLKLPSGGDTSYPGLVWRDGLLYVSYYSSHEGKTSIYLSKLRINYRCPACGGPMRTIPMLVGLPNEEMLSQLKQGKALLAGCVGNPHDPEHACVCPKCSKWKTATMKYWQDLPKQFGTANKKGSEQ